VLDRLHACLLENAHDPSNELLHGAPGTMVIAAELHRRTGEERWADAWRMAADELWSRWAWHGECGCDLWTQRLSGADAVYIGAGHGFAGCVMALLRGGELLGSERAAELERRAAATAYATAVREDGRANWPPIPGSLARNGRVRVQWCHGAPGIVTSLARLAPADDAFTTLLADGAELVWEAGPLTEAPGLCHGTAGNGMALLAMYQRSGDVRWLERARAFAVHALEQVDRQRAAYGVGRYSLWTGDMGVAVVARQCLDARPGVPTLDWV
jgi:lantibiotic modifying enzyme